MVSRVRIGRPSVAARSNAGASQPGSVPQCEAVGAVRTPPRPTADDPRPIPGEGGATAPTAAVEGAAAPTAARISAHTPAEVSTTLAAAVAVCTRWSRQCATSWGRIPPSRLPPPRPSQRPSELARPRHRRPDGERTSSSQDLPRGTSPNLGVLQLMPSTPPQAVGRQARIGKRCVLRGGEQKVGPPPEESRAARSTSQTRARALWFPPSLARPVVTNASPARRDSGFGVTTLSQVAVNAVTAPADTGEHARTYCSCSGQTFAAAANTREHRRISAEPPCKRAVVSSILTGGSLSPRNIRC